MTGTRTPSAIVPKEEPAGVDTMSLGGHPADGRDLGAAAGMSDTARAGEAQVARDDQPRGYGEGQQRQRHPKNQPKGCGAGPRHQQHKQRRRSRPREPRPPQLPRPVPPRVAPEQPVAAASTGDTARAEEAQAAPEKSSQGLGRTQTAALRKQERSRPRRAPRPPPLPPPPPRAAPEHQEAAADPGDAAGAEEREEPVLSDPDQRAALCTGSGGHGPCCSPATGPAGDAANKNGGGKVMLGILGQWIPSDADDPQSSQGDGAAANPGATP
jgi:hypothetical protein